MKGSSHREKATRLNRPFGDISGNERTYLCYTSLQIGIRERRGRFETRLGTARSGVATEENGFSLDGEGKGEGETGWESP